jgi:hypothetical protein
VALAVLVIVLVPALYLVTNSTKVVYNDQYKVTAANLANGQLETDRNQAVALQTLPASSLSIALPAGVSSNYKMSQVAGWCATPTSASPSWTTFSSTSNPYAFVVLVKVTWAGNATNGVQVSGVLTSPSNATPAAGTGCPI